MDDVNTIVTLVAESIAIIVAAASVIVVAWRKLRSMLRAMQLSDNLHKHFGTDPADQIKKLIHSLRGRVTEIAIRKRIVERSLNLGIYQCDAQGKCIWANDVLCDLFQRDSREMLGYAWLDALSNRRQVFENWKFAVTNGTPYEDNYVILIDDNTIHAKTQAFPAIVDDKIICYVGYVVTTGFDNEVSRNLASEGIRPTTETEMGISDPELNHEPRSEPDS